MNLVFFDIDGTLLISQGAGRRAILRVMRDVFGIVEEIARVRIHGQTDRGIATQLFAAHHLTDSNDNWNRFTAAYLEILDEELAKSDGWLLPGFPELLEVLNQQTGIELALLTGNVAAGAWKKVEHFGIGNFFSWGGFGDHHRDRSEMARSAMETAKNMLDLDSLQDVFVIGDTPNDIRCGKAISARTLGVSTSEYSMEELQNCQADFVLPDLSDIDHVVSILTGAENRSGNPEA